MDIKVYAVAGGWQAEAVGAFIACFGSTKQEASEKLKVAVERARDLQLRAKNRPARQGDDKME